MKNKRKKSPWFIVLSAMLLITLFALLFAAFTVQFIPPIFVGNLQLDFSFLTIAYFALLFLIYRKHKIICLTFSVLFTAAIFLLSSLQIGWSLNTILANATGNIAFLFGKGNSAQVQIRVPESAIHPHISLQKRIQQKVNYTDSAVRHFAVEKSLIYFQEYYPKYRQICRQLSLIKYIKENYRYVSDPSGFDYFASPTESISLMAGDCDDYSILMASVVKAIGGNVRIIWAPRHVYPELFCGDKASFDKYLSAIYLFFDKEIGNKQIYYRLDKNQNYWLNIDYTDQYPGSVYFCDDVLSIIYIK
ncbi:MAG: transglutaminase-like domain-containing protein [Lentimicrobiaceae bacterium]|nr:transglutaminase-like domain-containing protein [Lentimicrobiaceae bacterium]